MADDDPDGQQVKVHPEIVKIAKLDDIDLIESWISVQSKQPDRRTRMAENIIAGVISSTVVTVACVVIAKLTY